MRYLITGATGSLGSALVRALAFERGEIRVLVRDTRKFRQMFRVLPAEIIAGDVLSPADMERALQGVDIVFHCANFPLTSYAEKLAATKILVNAAARTKPHIVYPGNTWPFGTPAQLPITPETPFNPPSKLAKIEAAIDATLWQGSKEYGIPVTVLHLPDFYGPYVTNDRIAPLFNDALEHLDLDFSAPVDVPHEFIYIDDAARALLSVAGKEKAFGQRYTVAGSERTTVRSFCNLLFEALEFYTDVRGVPLWMLKFGGLFSRRLRALAGMMHVFSTETRMDGSFFANKFNFAPKVGLPQGILRTLEWFNRNGGHGGQNLPISIDSARRQLK